MILFNIIIYFLIILIPVTLSTCHLISLMKLYVFFYFFQADPKQVCSALGLCDSKKSKKVDAKPITLALPLKNHLKTILAPVLVAAKPKPAVIESKPLKASGECILCEFVMKELDGILQKNATKVWKHVVIM